MNQKPRIKRSKDDLKNELLDQLALLRASCMSYDNGLEAAGKQLAATLRVLLHHNPTRRSHALLDQLGYRNRRYFSTGVPAQTKVVKAPHYQFLSAWSFPGIPGSEWWPIGDEGPTGHPPRLLPFPEWWGELVLRDMHGNSFTRMDLVRRVADTDGGAHADPDLDEPYMTATRGKTFGFTMNGEIPRGRPELACMRQIAHEVMTTLCRIAPELLPHCEPVTAPKPVNPRG